jgi:ABC-type Co2+ transport system, periplasmic component
MKKIITLTIGLSLTLSAQAHMLWLERASDAKTHAFFGEYSEQLKETQEGALKSFSQAKAIQTKKQFSPQLHQDHLVYSTKDQADVQLHHELIYGESLLSYHAKSGRQNLKADSELDIVPVQPNSNTFTVMYQGKPAADVKVTVYSPQHWLKNYTTNNQAKLILLRHGRVNMY